VSNYEQIPIKCVHIGKKDMALDVVEKIKREGFFVCPASYPCVPKGHAG